MPDKGRARISKSLIQNSIKVKTAQYIEYLFMYLQCCFKVIRSQHKIEATFKFHDTTMDVYSAELLPYKSC